MLTERSARALATHIAKTSDGVRIKTGRTNGRVCLHLIVDAGSRYSETIYDEAEWDLHRENKANRPSKREQRQIDKDLADAVANREAK